MFEFMTTDMRKPLPETIDDLVKSKYMTVMQLTDELEFDRFNDEIVNGRPE
jgi:hypothetical protein